MKDYLNNMAARPVADAAIDAATAPARVAAYKDPAEKNYQIFLLSRIPNKDRKND